MDPDKKEITIAVYDQDEGDFVELIMDEGDYQAMVEYENQLEFEEYERRQRRED